MAYNLHFRDKEVAKIVGTTKNASKELAGARSDKLIIKYPEIRELMVHKLHKILKLKKFQVRDSINKLTFLLRKRLDNCLQIFIDNFGVIMKRKNDPKRKFNFQNGGWFVSDGFRYILRPHYNFRQYFRDEKIRKIVLQRCIRKSKEHYKKFGKKKLRKNKWL